MNLILDIRSYPVSFQSNGSLKTIGARNTFLTASTSSLAVRIFVKNTAEVLAWLVDPLVLATNFFESFIKLLPFFSLF